VGGRAAKAATIVTEIRTVIGIVIGTVMATAIATARAEEGPATAVVKVEVGNAAVSRSLRH